MKKMTKLLALLLALLLCVTSFVACSKKEESGNEEPASSSKEEPNEEPEVNEDAEKEEIKTVCEDYLTATKNFDIEGLKKCATDDNPKLNDYEKTVESGKKQYGFTEEETIEYQKNASAKNTFEIGDIEIDGDKATVTVMLTSPNTSLDQDTIMTLSNEYATEIGIDLTTITDRTEQAVTMLDMLIWAIENDKLEMRKNTKKLELEKVEKDWLVSDIK